MKSYIMSYEVYYTHNQIKHANDKKTTNRLKKQ